MPVFYGEGEGEGAIKIDMAVRILPAIPPAGLMDVYLHVPAYTKLLNVCERTCSPGKGAAVYKMTVRGVRETS